MPGLSWPPERGSHPGGSILRRGGGDVGIALSQPQVRVPQHLHDGANVHALLHEQSAGSMPPVVNTRVTHTGSRQEILPFLPVAAGVDGGAVDVAEHQVMIAPAGTRRCTLLELGRAMSAKDLDEDQGQSDGSPALPLGFTEHEAPAAPQRTRAGVTHAVLLTRWRAGPPVPAARNWAGGDLVPSAALAVLPEAARVRIGAAVLPRNSLQLPPHSEVTAVEVHVPPPEAQRLALAQPERQSDRPPGTIAPARRRGQ